MIWLIVALTLFLAKTASQQELDINIEISDGSPVTDEDVAFVQTSLTNLQRIQPTGNPVDNLLLVGLNGTEIPFYLSFYGFVFQIPEFFQNPPHETPILHRITAHDFLTQYEVWACNHNKSSIVGISVCDNMGELGFNDIEEAVAMVHAVQKYFQITHVCGYCNRSADGSAVHPNKHILQTFGYKYDGDSTDLGTPAGLGNLVGQACAELALYDGWNLNGKLTRKVNPMPFEDYTGYVPPNSPEKLEYPLGWQPLKESDGKGFFYFQQHVTPQLSKVKTLFLSQEDLEKRYAPWPYKGNLWDKQLNVEDEQMIRRYSQELFAFQRNLTDTQKMLTWYFDSKLRNLGTIPFNMERVQPEQGTQRVVLLEAGLSVILYDATVLVWKEKLRHNAVRPPSIIHHIFHNETIKAWGGYSREIIEILGQEYSPYIRTMPHSEYPSASACLCEAATEFFREFHGKDELVEPFMAFFPQGSSVYESGVVPTRSTAVLFRSFSEINRVCGESRLWGGLHFRPAIEAGRQLCRGVGKSVYEDLIKPMFDSDIQK